MGTQNNPATNSATPADVAAAAQKNAAAAAGEASAVDSADGAAADAATVTQSQDEKGEMTVEDYKAALAEARREAAKYRTERNELKPLAQKAKEIEEAGKSELEKAQERIAALEAEKRSSEQAALRARLAADAGVPAELIAGGTEEEMTASAAALKAFVDKKLADVGGPKLPAVGAVGRDGGATVDKDAVARQILGINKTM